MVLSWMSLDSLLPMKKPCRCPLKFDGVRKSFQYSKSAMATKIDTVSSRDKLKLRREPYWHRLSKGRYVGLRKRGGNGHGTWIARTMQESSGGKNYQALGEFSDLQDHLRFDAAQKAAQAWFDHLGQGGAYRAVTVSDACTTYVIHLRATKSERAANDAEARFTM